VIPLSVRAVGMICSVGDNAPECAASVRAGVQRIAESPVRSRRLHPLRMGLVPATSLAPLPVVDAAPRGTRHRRILRLAHAVLAEVRAASGGLSTPLSLVTSALDDGAPLLDDLAALPDARVDHARSAHFPAGAAGVFVALRDAAHRIAHGEVGAVTIVCADSLFDPARLDAMQIQRRLLVDDVMDGFVPGEGAAALLLTAAAPGGVATLRSVGTEPDPFTPDGDLPLTGDGLSRAVQAALVGVPSPVAQLWTALNGASWSAREWSIAARRAHGGIDGGARVHHPVECFGDPGAALGGMLLALASIGIAKGWAPGPSLVWAISEEGLRGAARVDVADESGVVA
jgi:3-oxoacyl-[acyl-carrier-protein] synthase-1